MNHRICLSLDIDWAHDDVIRDAMDLLDSYGAKADWFVTHATPMLDELRKGGHRLGLHPNFNPLLQGAGETAEDVLDRCIALAPEARCIRSHSLVSSSRLSALFVERGLTHESNYLISPTVSKDLGCWRSPTGIVHVPIRWEDDDRHADASFGEAAEWVGQVELLTLDFHPIHLFLNTGQPADYERARGSLQDPATLVEHRRPTGGGGSRDQLVGLLDRMATAGIAPTAMASLQPGGAA